MLSQFGKTAGLAFALSCAPALPAQSPQDLGASLQQVTAELRSLKAEMLEHRLEFQEMTIAMLERDLVDIRKQQERVEGQERANSRDIAQVDQQLAVTSLPQDERLQLEAARAVLTGQESQRISLERTALGGRETEIQRRVSAARERLQTLRQMKNDLVKTNSRSE